MSYTESRPRSTTIGDIVASAPSSGFVKSQPAIAVKTPSFKAPKVIGKKPAMITGKGEIKPHPFTAPKEGSNGGECKECGEGYKAKQHWRKA